eukprot:2592806-Pyramimonas_sp.AAC.1
MVTLQCVVSASNVQVWTAAAVEDEIREKLVGLEKAYVAWQSAPPDDKPKVEIKSPATEFFRRKTENPYKLEPEDIMTKMNLPTDEGYAEGMDAVMESVTWSLENYPVMRDRILEVLQRFVPNPEDGP